MAWIRGSLLGGTPPTPVVKQFRFLKWHITGTRSTSSYIQMSRIEFLDTNDNAYTYSSNFSGIIVNGTIVDGAVKNLADGNVRTKCCVSWNKDYMDIVLDLQSGYELDLNTYKKFQWYTANDSIERDPSTWILYGANISDFSDAVILNQAIGYIAPTTRMVLGFEGSLNITNPVNDTVKMVVSTGAQLIQLPYYSDDGIKLKFKMFLGYVNQNGVIFGDEWSSAGILFYTEGQTLELRVIGNVETNIPLPAYHIADVEFDYTTGILTIDGDTYGSYTLGGHKPIYLFGLSSGHEIWGALSDISIEQNGTEVMKLVAKKDASTGAGYYHDTIGGQNYYSTTSTDLLYTEI